MLGLAAARMHKLKDGLHLLSAAALLMLAWDPYMLSNVGFQLSFLVTAGLILGVPPVRAWLPNGSRTKALFDLIAVTMVAQAVSFPLTVYYFNQFHLLSLIANFDLYRLLALLSCRWRSITNSRYDLASGRLACGYGDRAGQSPNVRLCAEVKPIAELPHDLGDSAAAMGALYVCCARIMLRNA